MDNELWYVLINFTIVTCTLNPCRTSLLLLCITAGEGGYEYIHCPKDFTDSHIQNTTCYLNPRCPDKYIYISTVISNGDYHRCEGPCHHFDVWPVSSLSEDFHIYWSESEGVDDSEVTVNLIIKVRLLQFRYSN